MPIINIIIGIILVDQLSKYYIQSLMPIGMSIPIIENIFHLTYILNPGAAFGILENQRWFFVVVAFIMLVCILYIYPRIKAEVLSLRLGIALLVGGAIGNVIDRARTGYVVDFFDFRIWPIFNIADIAIVVGVGIIVYYLIFLVDIKGDNK